MCTHACSDASHQPCNVQKAVGLSSASKRNFEEHRIFHLPTLTAGINSRHSIAIKIHMYVIHLPYVGKFWSRKILADHY